MPPIEYRETNLRESEKYRGELHTLEKLCLRELVTQHYVNNWWAVVSIWSGPNPFGGKDPQEILIKNIKDEVEADLISKTGMRAYEGDLEEHLSRNFPGASLQETLLDQIFKLQIALRLADKGLAEYVSLGDYIHFRITLTGAKTLGFSKLFCYAKTDDWWKEITS